MFFESTIMGNTADLAMVQKTIIDTLHKESKPQRVITERGGFCSRSAVSKHIQCKVDWKDLGIKVPESGGRVERHRIHVAWSPVWSFHSQWWFGLPWHLLVLVHCFLKSTVNAAIYQDILEHFMLPSADKLYGDADFIFQQDLAPAHTAKGTKSWFNGHGVTVLDWPANSPDLNPRGSIGYCQEEDERHQTQQCRWPEGRYQRNLGFITPEQCHRLIVFMPRCIDAVIHAKGAPTKYWEHRNEHTFQKPDISV